MSKMVKKVNITKVSREIIQVEDKLVNDEEIKLIVNKTVIGNFSMSPTFLKEFAVGYLLGEGLLSSVSDIEKVDVDDKTIEIETSLADFDLRRELVMSSDCFGGMRGKIELTHKVESDYTISREKIAEAFERLKESSKVWKETGGTHIAALVTDDDFIAIEDVSRHVAIDKVIGAGALKGIDFSKSFIACSGRMPADMVIKIVRMGIPILTSRAAPTSSGLMVAEDSNVTMVGFVRGGRFNIYSYHDRILLD